jgi:hypothetical protein
MDERRTGDRGLSELLGRSEEVRRRPDLRGFVKLLLGIIGRPLRDPVGQLLASTVLLLVLWGPNGELRLLREVWADWRPFTDPQGRAGVIDGVPWDQEWISFGAGFALLVLVPCVLIKGVWKHDLRDYGLGLPARNRMRLSLFAAAFLLLTSLPAFLLATGDEGMRATYPLYRGPLDSWDFVVYELGYLLFFVAIEFAFRGYLLLGLFRVHDRDALEAGGERGRLLFRTGSWGCSRARTSTAARSGRRPARSGRTPAPSSAARPPSGVRRRGGPGPRRGSPSPRAGDRPDSPRTAGRATAPAHRRPARRRRRPAGAGGCPVLDHRLGGAQAEVVLPVVAQARPEPIQQRLVVELTRTHSPPRRSRPGRILARP